MPRQGSLSAAGAGAIRADPDPGPISALLHLAYDLLWLAAGVVGLPWIAWRCLRSAAFRRMLRERLGLGLAGLPRPDRPRILVHGVSVGEVKGAQGLVRELERAWPDREIVISATTATGLEVARRLYPEKLVVRFPFDARPAVRRFFERLRPGAVILVELEIWPSFLRAANRRGIPVAIVNGRITERSFSGYRSFRHLLPQLERISLICAQDEEYTQRFLRLGVDPKRVVLTGNIKADALRSGRADVGEELKRLLGPAPGQALLVAGSTHDPEEQWVAEAWKRLAPRPRLVIVPRHPQRCVEVVRKLRELGEEAQLLTELRSGKEAPDVKRVAIVDTIGELERVYGLAHVAFVGGSLVPHGGQNVLEPAAQGVPVVHGKWVANFAKEIGLLRSAGAAVEVAGVDELQGALAELLGNAGKRAQMGQAGQRAVEATKGATAETIAALKVCLG